jgi:hypothetical protein
MNFDIEHKVAIFGELPFGLLNIVGILIQCVLLGSTIGVFVS